MSQCGNGKREKQFENASEVTEHPGPSWIVRQPGR